MSTKQVEMRSLGGPKQRTRRFGAVALVVAVACSLGVVSCSSGSSAPSGSGSDQPGAAKDRPTEPVTPTVPRYRTERLGKGDLRIQITPEAPLFLYNVYLGEKPEQIRKVVRLWPEDLRPYLGIQLVLGLDDSYSVGDRAQVLDDALAVTDELGVPLIVQTATFSGDHSPDRPAIDAAFSAHRSFVGVSIAELSAGPATAVGGLQVDQRQIIAERIDQAVQNDGVFLWADMGYLGPQVFVDAGADPELHQLMQTYHEHIIIQAKQNGVGRRFGTVSAAEGLFLSGLADNWGINSEDWLWWEASFQQLYGPQVPGPFTIAGATKSEFPARAQLTYPEALYGTELLMTAAAGGTVFSIEAPQRGTVVPERDALSAAGAKVVFPVLRRLIRDRLIPSRAEVLARTKLAFQPEDRDPAVLGYDQAFAGLYGPQGCTPKDQLACAQAQWLPSTGRYGIVPTLPALADAKVTEQFPHVVTLTDTPDPSLVATAEAAHPAGAAAAGSSWAVPAAGEDRWFIANPNENTDLRATFALPASRAGTVLAGEIGPHTFLMTDTSAGKGRARVFLDNYRTDSDRWWEQDTPDDVVRDRYLDQARPAPLDTSTIEVRGGAGGGRPKAKVTGAAKVVQTWKAATGTLTLTISHRGPVTISVG